MATIEEHYENVLADVYSWIYESFENGIQKNITFFEKHNINPVSSKLAVDLGSGCGFQSIPLARRGFSVTAIDTSEKLLNELDKNKNNYKITTIKDDLQKFNKYIHGKVEIITCMTDTLLLIESKKNVESLFTKVIDSLEDNGKFIITFRDLSIDLFGTDRFIPIKSDDNTIFLCFLEYESEIVKVNDIVYVKRNGTWDINKSFYKKLRLSKDWVKDKLFESGFINIELNTDNGFITIIATK